MDERANCESAEENSSGGIGIWGALIGIALGYAAYAYWIAPQIAQDKFDPLDTLFSGLAFWGVIYAILLQKSELKLQRVELSRTREQIQGQKEQLETQNLTMKRQRFENTLFSLLDLFNSIVNSLEISRSKLIGQPPDVMAKGRECFKTFYQEFKNDYDEEQKMNPETRRSELCVLAYDRFVAKRQTSVGHYFRTLYNIIKFIATSDVQDKQTYINIVRAQLSSSELNLLFYNCLSRYGSEHFQPYVEQFGLLEGMVLSDLIREEHKDLYKESAFRSPV